MEKVIKIEGGHDLNGTVRISGSKNATVALIPACVLGNEPVTIYGVPNISDVQSLIVLLNELGVYVEKRDEETLYIDPTHMENIPMVSKAVSKLRASYYFMGALLGKFGHAEIKMPGGCYLGPRPIDLHLKGFEALGADIQYENGCYILDAKELKGTNIFLDISSVGATINIMMAAVYAKGRTVIENAAREPEIIDIATLLNKMGANANEQKKLLMECVSMLEKYVNRFPAEKGCASFSGEDMKLWKEVYFPKLVQTDILLDGKFFCGTSSGNSGIGTDGYFTGYEFFQFIYRAYKALYELEKASQMR